MSGNSPINGEWRTDLLTPCQPSERVFIYSTVVTNCVTGAPGAMEMSWLQVQPEELLEPIVTVVSKEQLLP